jgi:hypothetical protein
MVCESEWNVLSRMQERFGKRRGGCQLSGCDAVVLTRALTLHSRQRYVDGGLDPDADDTIAPGSQFGVRTQMSNVPPAPLPCTYLLRCVMWARGPWSHMLRLDVHVPLP